MRGIPFQAFPAVRDPLFGNVGGKSATPQEILRSIIRSRMMSITHRGRSINLCLRLVLIPEPVALLDSLVDDMKKENPGNRLIRSYPERVRRFDREFGTRQQRQAKATMLQQMEDDTLKMVIMPLHSRFRDLSMKSRIVVTIHDAIYVEAPAEEKERARQLMKEQMEKAVELPLVPLEVDLE
jgi:DNA-binding GntR family transcriptional regulator